MQRNCGARHGYERFLAGAAAGVTATVTCFPLDVVRTRMMSPAHSTGLLQTVGNMLRYEGVGAFYTGCLPAVVSMAIGGAVFYGTYDWLKSLHLLRLGHDPCAHPHFPTLRRFRLAPDGDTFSLTLRLVLQHGVRYNTVLEQKRYLCRADAHDVGQHKMKLDAATTLMFGAAAGLSAEICTYPLEVIRRKMQLERTLAMRHIATAPTGTRAAARRLVRTSCTAPCYLEPDF